MYKKTQHSELYRELLENKPDNIKILKYLKPKQLAFIADNGTTPLMKVFNYFKWRMESNCDNDIILKIVKLSTNHGYQNTLNGKTALILACQKYSRSPNFDRKVFMKLLSTDCNAGAVDDAGYTALMFAIKEQINPEIINKLLDLDCKPGAVNKDGDTALKIAFTRHSYKRDDTCCINQYNLIKKLYLKSSADERKRYFKNYIKLRNTHEIRPLMLWRHSKRHSKRESIRKAILANKKSSKIV